MTQEVDQVRPAVLRGDRLEPSLDRDATGRRRPESGRGRLIEPKLDHGRQLPTEAQGRESDDRPSLEFETWRSLVGRQGPSRARAVDATARLVSSV